MTQLDTLSNKATQRRAFRVIRNEFVAGLREAEKAIAFSCIPGPMMALLKPGQIVAGYVAKDNEADPSALLLAAHEHGCRLALPHVTSQTSPMRFLRWNPGDTLETGPFGLQQPPIDAEECVPAVLFVPLVAFDSRLMRLGQGAGHYDRALSVLPEATAIGIAWSVQHAPSLVADPWDIPMNAVLTEKAWMTI